MDPKALLPFVLGWSKTQTGPDGRFAFELVTPGRYRVNCEVKGFAPVVEDLEVRDGVRTEVTPPPLVHGAFLTGIVYGHDSQPAPGAVVQLTAVDPEARYSARVARSDASGRYTIRNAPPGRFELGATRSRSDNPFDVIGDLRRSKVEVSLVDGTGRVIDLYMDEPRSR